jgi:triosephosphate isomerase
MPAPVTIGVSLKMYFGHGEAIAWCDEVARIAAENTAVMSGDVEFFVVPSYLAILPALEAFGATPVMIGAQDLATDDRGAFTGEVSGAELAEAGVRIAEVGHAERRRLFHEDDDIVAAKTSAALRHRLTPVLCLGEPTPTSDAAGFAVRQLQNALRDAPPGRVIVAYEPVWAIGAAQPSDPAHVRTVCAALQEALGATPEREGSSVIYGGSAGPGLLSSLRPEVDGLFLGRFAHDPNAVRRILDEAAAAAA